MDERNTAIATRQIDWKMRFVMRVPPFYSRYSSTLMERSFYCASRLDDGSILRLSVTHSTVLTLLLGMSQPVFLVFSIGCHKESFPPGSSA